ncbi:chemotaxis protein CheY [Bradyrhizobium sp. CCBAU 11434]|uniref:response regulator n=1 Tax=Bradyrhizobium sp. CCBAU 11434 TaxID=1630885 RepID=UPI00230667D7|nr:response regulator [Bradyrhizobium sp. CCBAU 11434]MDA9521396.1 chemotaxis protein CheY [Bradyrhizobium sp. CCBAU 11434]
MPASILLVEDEALIRMMLVEMIEEAGHSVVAEAGDVKKGAALATNAEFDLAILDINVGGDTIEPIASAIAIRGKPFFFVSGYGSSGVPHAFRGTQVVRKPCLLSELQSAIETTLSQLRSNNLGPI